MIVISLTNCPISLRGDLTKWLFEIDTGVFVGNVSARVRELLWERVVKSAKNGRATMVFSANNEQGLDFKIHNSSWIPIDFDGLELILRPNTAWLKSKIEQSGEKKKLGYSNASRFLRAKRKQRSDSDRACAFSSIAATNEENNSDTKKNQPDYVVIDIETTGLDADSDEIVMIGALKVTVGQPDEELKLFIKTDQAVALAIVKMIGASATEIENGVERFDALRQFESFVGGSRLVGHNIAFDIKFINYARKSLSLEPLNNETVDTLKLARQKLYKLKNHRLSTVAEFFGLSAAGVHNALTDCRITRQIFEKLKG
jgi:CRISPR-associated protein Cas2